MAQGFSNLEVAYGQSLPEVVVQSDSHPEVVASAADKYPAFDRSSPPEVFTGYSPDTYEQYTKLEHDAPRPSARRICFLSPKRFWVCFVLALLVAGGVIGGALGGTRPWEAKTGSSNSSGEGSGDAQRPEGHGGGGGGTAGAQTTSEASAPATTPTPTEPRPSTPSLTTSTVIRPTQTMLRDCPSSNGTVYEAFGLRFLKACNAGPDWVRDNTNVVNQRTASLDECIDLCIAHNVEKRSQIAAGAVLACNAVGWRNDINDRDWPGQCFGSVAHVGDSVNVPLRNEPIADSAVWINQQK